MNSRDFFPDCTNLAITYSVFLRALFFISWSLLFQSFLTFEPLNKNQGLVVRMLTDVAHGDFSTGNPSHEFHPFNKNAALGILFSGVCVGIIHSIICPMSKLPGFPELLFFPLCFIFYRSAGSACTAVCQEIKYLYSMYICSEHGVKVKICWLVHFYQLQLWGHVNSNYYRLYKWKVKLIQYQNAAVHFKLCWERSECKGESNIFVSTSLISSFSYVTITQ